MRQVRAVVTREVGAFFHSAMAPAVLAGFLVAVGLFFTIFLFGYSDMSLTALQSPRSGNFVNLAEGLFRPLVSNSAFFLLFLMPALTMRLFAPELESGRYNLIASWPVADHVWVIGKWFSSVVCAGIMILAGTIYVGTVWLLGDPEPGPALTALLGQLLFAGCLAAWGLLTSSMVRHQMVAYFLAFIWSMLLFIVGSLERFLPGATGEAAREFSSLVHFEKFTRGVIDTRDLLYFGLMTVVPLFAAQAVLAGRRLPAGRRLAVWTPTLLAIALAFTAHALGQQFSRSWDTTGNRRYSLAPQSKQVLDGLGGDLDRLAERAASGEEGVPAGDLDHVQVYAFYQRLDPARDITEALLKSCAQRSRRFRFQVIDPEVELELLNRFGVTVTRSVVVTVGDRHTTLLQPEESALVSAVYRLASGKKARVCFLAGHGEHRLDSDDRPGYSTTGQLLFDQGYDVRPLQLGDQARVPASCDVLVIAGPRLEPLPVEIAAIDDHLERGGAVLALFDPPTPDGWVEWAAGFRVGLLGDVLVDVERVGVQQGIGARTMVVGDGYGDHEIVSSLQGVVTVFPMVQPLAQIGEPDSTVFGAVLIKSSDKTWAERNPAERFSGKPSFHHGVDVKGPLPFGMVIEVRRGGPEGRAGRLAVFGNSEFLNNATVNVGGNRDLALNAVGWLAREEGLIQIRGRDPLSQPVVLSDEQKNVFGFGAVVGWPLLVGSLALGLMLRHRRDRGASP